ncbi:FAD-dependent oxidoreductase [Stenotrophomonas sp. SY1]|uniref:FAD/NAD(P)-dependent oxidoreductase n=1 Tax=Stenotrophomonas sp. SY1 TaxID=477235 RepID=UPI001E62CE80|nr:FAD-dependent oxidoreductase [Stenotrophomonas sp. SY1]MCD9085241.1 FAD-dependent oxidoreductase [Stenotrophomonas sp. SY1]
MAEHLRCDVAVIGAGPAGLSAAVAAAGQGARVVIVDASPQAGGQIWRNDVRFGAPAAARALREQVMVSGAMVLSRHEVVAASGGQLLLNGDAGAATLEYGNLVLATGARELLLPFPGWTLPGVTGAGGAQALAKQGAPMQGRRVVLAGSGPLLLASAYTLKRHGAEVVGIHEQATRQQLHAFAAALWRWPAKVMQAVQLRTALAGVPYHCDSHVLRALGDARVEAVELQRGNRTQTIACDQLACGFGLVPNIELAQLLSCDLHAQGRHAAVRVDEFQRTSVAGIFAAGEACGIGGVDCATVEGSIAGLAAANASGAARRLFPRRARARHFAALLGEHFALGDAVRRLADADTLVCRCEDVRFSDLAGMHDARAIKLKTRCGMGPCQGRICGPALAEIVDLPRTGSRPPVFPVPLNVLAALHAGTPTDSSSGVMK